MPCADVTGVEDGRQLALGDDLVTLKAMLGKATLKPE
jgi:hypothetical protein